MGVRLLLISTKVTKKQPESWTPVEQEYLLFIQFFFISLHNLVNQFRGVQDCISKKKALFEAKLYVLGGPKSCPDSWRLVPLH